VSLSELKNKFAEDLAQVKRELYKEATSDDALFADNPESARSSYQIGGLVLAALGAGLVYVLGEAAGAGLLGVPVIVAGVVLFLFAAAMPRRTAQGRELFRRSLGFREFMVTTSDEQEQKLKEEAGIFDKYLPYAIVFGCAKQWAERFQSLDGQVPRS